MPLNFNHDTFFKEGCLMFLEDFVELVFRINRSGHLFKVTDVTRNPESQPGSGTADLCLEVEFCLGQDGFEEPLFCLLIVEHKSFYDETSLLSQVKYHNAIYQEQKTSGNKKFMAPVSVFCHHGKRTSKIPKTMDELLLKRGLSQAGLDFLGDFLLSLKWMNIDFSDKKVLSVFKECECFYMALVLHKGLDFKVTEDSLIEIVEAVNRIQNPNKRVKAMESVFVYLGNVFPEQMTRDLLRSVDSRAKQENLLKEGEDIMTYSSMKELVMSEALAKGMAQGIAEGMEKGIAQGIDQGMEKGRREVALNMLQSGFDLKTILKATKLSEDDLKDLQKNK